MKRWQEGRGNLPVRRSTAIENQCPRTRGVYYAPRTSVNTVFFYFHLVSKNPCNPYNRSVLGVKNLLCGTFHEHAFSLLLRIHELSGSCSNCFSMTFKRFRLLPTFQIAPYRNYSSSRILAAFIYDFLFFFFTKSCSFFSVQFLSTVRKFKSRYASHGPY